MKNEEKWAVIVTNTMDGTIESSLFCSYDDALEYVRDDMREERRIQSDENGNDCKVLDDELESQGFATLEISTPRSEYSYSWTIQEIK